MTNASAFLLAAALSAAPAAQAGPEASRALSLTEAVDSARATHPSLARAGAGAAGARAAVAAARSAYLPGVVVDGSVTRFEEPMLVAPLHRFDPTAVPAFDRTLLRARAGVAYTVWDGGARGARVRVADASAAAADASHDEAEAALLEGVTAAFVAVVATRQVEDAARALVTALESEVARSRRRFEEGVAPRVEVLRAEAARADAHARAAQAGARRDVAEHALARWTGMAPDALAARPLEPVRVPDDPPEVAAGSDAVAAADVASGRSNTPAVRSARHRLEAAEAALAVARAGRSPSLDAAAGVLGFGSGDADFVAEWQAGLEVAWPVFTGGARRASVRRAEAEVEAARSEVRLAELARDAAVTEAAAAVVEARARLASLEASVARWDEVARIEALALDAGAGLQSDWLAAQAALYEARAGQTAARSDAVLARVRLARALDRLDRAWMDSTLEMIP